MLWALLLGATLGSGMHFTCALGDGGAVYCWGANESGQLGDGTREPRAKPVRVLGLTGMKDVACGSNHACAVGASGDVWCWGGNGQGQAGDALELLLFEPRKVAALAPVERVFAGASSSCAVTKEHALVCWGRNSNGQLGAARPDGMSGRSAPGEIAGVADVRSVVFSEGHVCVLTGRHEVYCWGDNDHGRTGSQGKTVVAPTRVDVDHVVAIAATNLATHVLRDDGRVVWWGARQGARDFESAPSPRTADERDVTALFSSRYAAYFRRGPGEAIIPGSGVAPLLPPVDLSWAVELVAGDNHACGRARDGGVRCWGWNRDGVGLGSLEAQKTPVPVRLDAAAQRPTRRGAPPAEACAPPVVPPEPAPRPSCGNGVRDSLGTPAPECAPCMPGHSCPCAAPVEVIEPCDGADLGGVTCASIGFSGGVLECTRRCTFDTSGCLPKGAAPPGVQIAWPRIPADRAPARTLALASSGRNLGALWGDSGACGQAIFARFSPELAPVSTSAPFGRGRTQRSQLAATPAGWLAALGDNGTSWTHAISADGKPSREKAALVGRPVFLESFGPEGPWLVGLSTRNHEYLGSLSIAVLDAQGAVLAESEVFGPTAQTTEMVELWPPQADGAAAVGVGGSVLVARSQLVPGREAGGVVVARVSKAGRVEATGLVAPSGVAPFFVRGERGVRLGWLRNDARPGQIAHYVAETVVVDDAGAAKGAIEPFGTLEGGEWFVSGAASTTSAGLLLPRLDVSGSTVLPGAGVRLELLEPKVPRTTLSEGKGVGPSRLISWGDYLVAGWLWQTPNDPRARLGLAKLLPAASR
jgi:hypothetical protein